MTDESPPETPEVEPGSSPDRPRMPRELDWLPLHPVSLKPIDGRSRDAQALKARLRGYWRVLTGEGRRELAPQEIPLIRSCVSLEYSLGIVLGDQARGKPAGEDQTRLSSELRRTLGDLGLSAPGVLLPALRMALYGRLRPLCSPTPRNPGPSSVSCSTPYVRA